MTDNPSCLLLDKQAVSRERSFALDKAGRSIPARIAIMAITTSSSIKVNPGFFDLIQQCVAKCVAKPNYAATLLSMRIAIAC